MSAPEQCPVCGGPLTVERVDSQYREEIVRRTWVRRFNIPVCRRTQCEQRVQGRHPLQTSDALGAAAVQVGPEAVTLGVLMNKSLGLPRADAFMGMSEPDKSPAASPTTCALPTPTSTSRPPSSPSAGLPSLGSRRAIFHRPPQPIFDAPGADNSKRRAKRILPNP
ncbi:hypothetical protein SBA3_2900001 [Candidatus Sulfopaludibacter sp. SbA3]|nr:hypothetical protein SBA3_2900001 [Candidatus Sulfopaludibacter sp. SbA3]